MFAIDVSEWNGAINWHLVAQNKPHIDLAMIKATNGIGYTDKRLVQNAKDAHAAGIPVGYYHYATINNQNVIEDATAEAKYFLQVIRDLPEAQYLVLDVEENDQYFDPKGNKVQRSVAMLAGKLRDGYKREPVLSPFEMLNWIKTFLGFIPEQKRVLYSYTPFLNANLPQNHGLGNVPLWIAAYTAHVQLPRGWDKQMLWQYSNKGKILGINTNVDLNR